MVSGKLDKPVPVQWSFENFTNAFVAPSVGAAGEQQLELCAGDYRWGLRPLPGLADGTVGNVRAEGILGGRACSEISRPVGADRSAMDTIIPLFSQDFFHQRKMDRVVLQFVSKVFRHRPALFNWMGRERGGETRRPWTRSLSAFLAAPC